MRTDPFRDEVAIDFPSTLRFIERVQEGFAERATHVDEPLRADVSVSWEDARRGVELPLSLSLRATCHVCGGRGETWADPCVECESTGETLVPCRLRVRLPGGVPDGGRLRLRVRMPHSRAVPLEVRVAVRPRH